MENARKTELLDPYLESAIPRLFDETKSHVEMARKKLESGSDLHSGDIWTLRDAFYEESLDAKSLSRLVRSKTSSFAWGWDERVWKSECAQEAIGRLSAHARSAVTAVLESTSMWSAFFTSSLTYFEELESRNPHRKDLKIDEETLFQLIGEDFERAKAAHRSVNESVWESVAPIQGEIAFHANAGNDSEVAKLAIERSIIAERLRRDSQPVMDVIASDFEKLRRRAAKHGYKLSFAWD